MYFSFLVLEGLYSILDTLSTVHPFVRTNYKRYREYTSVLLFASRITYSFANS